MGLFGNKIHYKGFYRGVKSMVLQHGSLLIQFDNGKIIAYDLPDVPKVLFDENE